MGTSIDGEERLRRLYTEHGAMLLAYATRWNNGDWQHGEDAVQETLVRAWRHPLPADSTPQAERSWLLTVARNVCIDRHRARQARPNEIGGASLQAVETTASADEIDRAVEQWTVAEALAKLTPDHREVLEETFFRGHSVAETATRLGIPQGTVKSRAFNALRALRKALAAQGVSA